MISGASEGGGGRSSFLSRKGGSSARRSFSRYSPSTSYSTPGNGWRARLASRSRVTNLGIGLLLAFASLSTLVNLLQWSRSAHVVQVPSSSSSAALRSSLEKTRKNDTLPALVHELAPPPRPGAEKLDHLVVVPGHAIWMGSAFEGRFTDDNWVLEDYQKGGSVRTFWKHIQRGIEIANTDPGALLVFSGGQTRPHSAASEAESYFQLALQSHMDLPVLPGAEVVLKMTGEHGAEFAQLIDADKDGAGENPARPQSVSEGKSTSRVANERPHVPAGALTTDAGEGLDYLRMTTESYALDSYENLLFSIARFREYTTRYPQRITVVGYEMKKERFEELHAKAVRWPTKTLYKTHRRFYYVGFDDDGDTTQQYVHEKQNGYALFDKDMYGCHGDLLVRIYVAACATNVVLMLPARISAQIHTPRRRLARMLTFFISLFCLWDSPSLGDLELGSGLDRGMVRTNDANGTPREGLPHTWCPPLRWLVC